MKQHLLPALVIAIGCLAMLGNITGIAALKKLGLATAASPYPKVFCDAPVYEKPGEEIETFASIFTLSYLVGEEKKEVVITPELYSKIRGPYNRRNVYGAILSYAPALPPEMWREGFDKAFLNPGTLRGELRIPEDATDIQVTIESQTAGRLGTWILK